MVLYFCFQSLVESKFFHIARWYVAFLLTRILTFLGYQPVEIRKEVVFKCVKLTNLADRQHEYAYQTVVEIGGHVFKGFLYDQGPEIRPTSSHLASLVIVQPELQLGSTSSVPLVDFDGLYGSGNHEYSFHNAHVVQRNFINICALLLRNNYVIPSVNVKLLQ